MTNSRRLFSGAGERRRRPSSLQLASPPVATSPRRTRAPQALPPPARAAAGFLHAWEHCLGGYVPTLAKRAGRPARVPLTRVLPALIFHVMSGAGTLAEHFFRLFDESYAESSLSARRSCLPWEVFAELMKRMLRPLATRKQAGAFWRGWRVVAIDGTQFSLANTPGNVVELRQTAPDYGYSG